MEGFNRTSYAPVPEFYAGKSVFITGGTGFLGKVLIEKLLHSCVKIHNIYVLLRDKNGTAAEERLREMLKSPVFGRLQEENPKIFNKIKPIVGDITAFNLGLTSDQEVLLEKVSVVFHLAASIRFNEPLKSAVTVNLDGTREILRVFKKYNTLEAFVYMSTAFSNSDRAVIDECIYPPPRSLDDVYERVRYENADENISEFLNGRPNTYTFTKALAENLVAQEHGDLPVVIVRPSIVTPAAMEPMKGWIDNWLGITTFILSYAKGWTRVLYGNKHIVLDLIPVDYVVNLTITAGARCQRSTSVPVFNVCSSSCNPISIYSISQIILKESARHNFNDFPLFSIIFSSSVTSVTIFSFILETIPAYLADFWLIITGKRESSISYVKAQSKQSKMREHMYFFQSHSWRINSARISGLIATLSPQDRQTFPFDVTNLKWSEYIPTYFYGMKRYLIDSRNNSV